MNSVEAGTVIVGSGLAGVLVAREVASSDSVAIVERGSLISWAEQIRRYESQGSLKAEGDGPGSAHNDENDPAGVDWLWEYIYAVGGTCNHWIGTALRFLPEDFEMRSRYGVMTDWPLSYDDLAPYYEAAERALGVAGAPSRLMPGTDYPLPPHPLSPQDRAVAPHLRPFIPLAQARPSRPVGTRPACCGSSRCELCPVDARFSVLNGLGETLERQGVRLLPQTTGVRLVTGSSGRRVEALECRRDDGTAFRVHGGRFVVAANAIESAGMMLRSGIDDPDTGRYFASRQDIVLLVSTGVPVDPGYGASLETGVSYAYYPGPSRARRAAALLAVENLGAEGPMADSVIEGVLDGHDGAEVRDDAVSRWERTLAFSVSLDYEPSAENTVSLSPTRDSFRVPLNRVTYNPGAYSQRGLDHLVDDLPRRLSALGAHDARLVAYPIGPHLLGTLRMGSGSRGVVDSDLRHRRLENLFVCGGAVFPTYAATPPTLTIAALAIRLGRLLDSA
jgi:glucose dehydrogenase